MLQRQHQVDHPGQRDTKPSRSGAILAKIEDDFLIFTARADCAQNPGTRLPIADCVILSCVPKPEGAAPVPAGARRVRRSERAYEDASYDRIGTAATPASLLPLPLVLPARAAFERTTQVRPQGPSEVTRSMR